MEDEFEFTPADTPPPKSSFVNVLAWIFIVLSGFTTFISILQNIMIFLFFPRDQMREAIQQAPDIEQIPAFARLMMSHVDLFFLGFLIVSTVTLICAIGLLKRMNWARLFFIGIMALGIVWNIGGLALQFSMVSSMQGMTHEAAPAEFQTMMTIMKVAMTIMALGMSGLFAWIIRKLISAPIRAEFS